MIVLLRFHEQYALYPSFIELVTVDISHEFLVNQTLFLHLPVRNVYVNIIRLDLSTIMPEVLFAQSSIKERNMSLRLDTVAEIRFGEILFSGETTRKYHFCKCSPL